MKIFLLPKSVRKLSLIDPAIMLAMAPVIATKLTINEIISGV
jgi:hypothetical protein